MEIKAIKTHRIEFGDSLENILDMYIGTIAEGEIIAITSKIISICQGNFIKKTDISKYDLVRQEADLLLATDKNPYDIYLTIKDGILLPTAGIDESNVNDVYVLLPRDVQDTAKSIWQYLRQKHKISNLGIVITDSHTTIMRSGVTGIALGWCGFKPLYSYIGKPDIYGKNLQVTQVNILDSLATSAVFVMGEGDEQTPFTIISNAPKISFLNRNPNEQEEKSVIISIEEDLYAPLILSAKWLKN